MWVQGFLFHTGLLFGVSVFVREKVGLDVGVGVAIAVSSRQSTGSINVDMKVLVSVIDTY